MYRKTRAPARSFAFVASFLAKCKINNRHTPALEKLGFAEIEDFADADDALLIEAGLTNVEIKRLRRYVRKESCVGRMWSPPKGVDPGKTGKWEDCDIYKNPNRLPGSKLERATEDIDEGDQMRSIAEASSINRKASKFTTEQESDDVNKVKSKVSEESDDVSMAEASEELAKATEELDRVKNETEVRESDDVNKVKVADRSILLSLEAEVSEDVEKAKTQNDNPYETHPGPQPTSNPSRGRSESPKRNQQQNKTTCSGSDQRKDPWAVSSRRGPSPRAQQLSSNQRSRTPDRTPGSSNQRSRTPDNRSRTPQSSNSSNRSRTPQRPSPRSRTPQSARQGPRPVRGAANPSGLEKVKAAWQRFKVYKFPGTPDDAHGFFDAGETKLKQRKSTIDDEVYSPNTSEDVNTSISGWTEHSHVIGKRCNAASNGTFLTLHALRRIRITGFACGTPYNSLDDWMLTIYSRDGPARGHEHSSEGWTTIATRTGPVEAPSRASSPNSASDKDHNENMFSKCGQMAPLDQFVRFYSSLLVEKGTAISFYLHSPRSKYAIVDCLVEKATLVNDDMRMVPEYRHDDTEPFNMKTCVDRRYVPAICILYEVWELDRRRVTC